ncbi:MAG: PD-(D/E)XK nuclease family protein [Gammaproteobacteria bacterium]|nr:PD-(D/E)XK nuclease family protein [Gammaproteobacteria bacterium]
MPDSEIPAVSVRAKPLVEMSASLAAKIEQSHTVTPNRRIARAIEEAYGDWQLARGARAWARPDVTTLSAYVRRASETLFVRHVSNARILSPVMQQALFLSVAPSEIADPENWYDDIARAWTLHHHYRLADDESAHLETSNTLVFRRWALRAQAILDAQSLITEAELANTLLAHLKAGTWHPAKPLIAWGFGDAHPLAPVEADLLTRLSRIKCLTRLSASKHTNPTETPRLVEFEQPEDELRTIALMARHCLERATEPVAIGIAFPQAGARRMEIERQLGHVLYPEHTPAPDHASLFDIAGGAPLDTFAVCRHALLFLRMLVGQTTSHEVESLLDSPFLDISKTVRLGASAKRKRPISAWLASFQKALQAVSWPTGRQFDSAAFQHAQALGALAADMASASQLAPQANAEAVLRKLERAARERYHEVQRTGAPIRVLDIEDACEFRFTHLWVAGMRGTDWPASSAANPFLPRSSQRAAGVPGVTPDSRLRLARRIVAKLTSCAPTLVFSYAQFDGDEHHGASALLPDTIRTTPEFFLETHHRGLAEYAHPYMAAEATALIATDDHEAPPCTDEEREGTAALVRDQSNCPFRAFARHRLGITEALRKAVLPSAREIGNAVHLALELAYRHLPDQSTLMQHPDRDALAKTVAAQSIDTIMPRLPARLRTGCVKHLAEIVSAWFDEDMKRPPYTNLQAETEVAVTIEHMALRLKIDRIDQDVATGQWLITDYKTSPPALTQLRSNAQLHEPQLLVYAEALRETRGDQVLSLAFGATGHAGEVGYSHCSTDARFTTRESGRNAAGDILRTSGTKVRAILRDFALGIARVTPRPHACDTCHLHPLCRIGQESSNP